VTESDPVGLWAGELTETRHQMVDKWLMNQENSNMQRDAEAREVEQIVLRYLTEIYQNWVQVEVDAPAREMRFTKSHGLYKFKVPEAVVDRH
jgi:hypothetical protein